MNISKKIGIAGGIATIALFSAAFVFAQGKPNNTNNKHYGFGAYRASEVVSPNASQRRSDSIQRSVQAHRQDGQAKVANQIEKARQRVTKLQDKAKQQIAAHLITQFDHINKVWTDHFAKILDRYDAILQKIQNRADIAAANGKDISATAAKIQSAKTAITDARSAVETQAAKTYTIDTSSVLQTSATSTSSGQEHLMQSLRSSFKTLRDQLFKDLFALRNGPMTNVRKAVQSALQTLGQIPGVDQENATSTKS